MHPLSVQFDEFWKIYALRQPSFLKITPFPSAQSSFVSSTPHSHDFYHQRLVLLFLEPYINGTTQYILFSVLLLSLSMFLKLIHVVVFQKFIIF